MVYIDVSFCVCVCVFVFFLNYGQFVSHRLVILCFCVLFGCFLVVSTSAIDCLERLVSEMTCYVSSKTLNSAHCSLLTF